MKVREALGLVTLVIVVLVGTGLLFNWRPSFPPVQPSLTPSVGPATQTGTFTPPPERGQEAITRQDTDCFDWSNKHLVTIDALELVSVRGRNAAATWAMVKWDKFGDACWVQADLLRPRNFKPEDLYVIKEPFPPATLTPTLATTTTPTPTLKSNWPPGTTILTGTSTKKPISPDTLTHTSTPGSPTPTNTLVSPTPTDTPISPTPTDTPISPTPTNTPISPTPTDTDTPHPPCERPTAPKLKLDRHGQNVNLSWDPIPGAVNYDLYRAVDTDQYALLTSTTATSFRDSLPNNTTHHYYVVVTNSCGETNTSDKKETSR